MLELLPYFILLAVTVVASVFSVLGRDIKKFSMIGLLVAFFLSVYSASVGSFGRFYNTLFINDFALFFNILFLLAVYLIALFSSSFIKNNAYYILILFTTFGMMVVASTTNIVAIYVAIEMVSLATYALVVSGRTKESHEAGMKYFIITIFASALILFGMAFLYSAGGGTAELGAMTLSATPLTLLAIILLTAGLGFKTGASPFNLWIPDVYQGAPGQIAGLLAGVTKKAGFAALFLIFFFTFRPFSGAWAMPWALLAFITMTLGNVAALSQENVKRLVAYSVIGQTGYIMIAMATVSELGLIGGLFHSFTHTFMVIGVFFIIAALSGKGLDKIEDFAGMYKRSPFIAMSLLIFLASLAGIPPLAGFVSKFVLFAAAIESGFIWLAVAAVINSAISVYYYFRIARAMFSEGKTDKIEISSEAKVAIGVCVAILIIFGLYPNPVLDLAGGAARLFALG